MPPDKHMTVHVTIDAADQASEKIKKAAESLHGLEAALRNAQTSSEQFRSKWDATFNAAEAVGGKMQIAGAAILGLGGVAVKTASDFGEMSQMAGEVFKGQTDAVTAWADATGAALNRSSADLLQYAAGFQGLFTPMGIGREEASKMSEAVATLAVDLGSFWNKQEPDVVRDLQSAFAGETEAMRKYGVFLSDAALDQELFNRGIKGGSQAATEAEKAHARMAIIMRATKDAQGDAARTAGSLENQIKGLQAELKEAAIAAGQALVPALEELAPIAKELLQDLTAFLQTPAGEAFVKWAAKLALVGVTGGTVVKHLGDIAFGAVQIGSLATSVWDKFGGGAKKAAEATEKVAEAVEKAAEKTKGLDGVAAAVGGTAAAKAASRAAWLRKGGAAAAEVAGGKAATSALIAEGEAAGAGAAAAAGAAGTAMGAAAAVAAGAALGLGLMEWARQAYNEHQEVGREIADGLAGGIESSNAILDAMSRKIKDGILRADGRKAGEDIARDIAAGMKTGSFFGDLWRRIDRWGENTALGVEAALGFGEGQRREDETNARVRAELLTEEADRVEALKAAYEAEQQARARSGEGSREFLEAQRGVLEAMDKLLAARVGLAERTPGYPKEKLDELAAQYYVVVKGLQVNAKAQAALGSETETTTQLTKAQTKANEDAIKAADGYADAQDAAAKATADVSEAVANADKRVREAAEGQTAAWRDAAERIVDAQQAVADAVEYGADRVEDAQKRVADATKAAADAEVDTAEQIIDLNDSLADARERAEDAAKALAKTEKDVAAERVKIEEDAAEKIDDIRKSSADKLKSLSERMAELQAKLRGDDKGNMFMVGGRMVMVSDKEADAIRERLKLMEDIRRVQADITKAKADEAAKIKETRDAERERLDEWAEKSPGRIGQARESRDDAAYALSKAERRIPRQIAQAEERLADAHQAVAEAEESLADAREDAARRIADSEKALAKAKEAATKAINDAEEKRLDAEAARAKTFASISEKLEQVAEKLGIAWMKLDASGRASTMGAGGAMNYAASRHQTAMATGRGLMGITAPDVTRAMAAFSGTSITPPNVAGLGFGAGGMQSGNAGGTATVVIGLEPGLVARQLQQDPARGVVVQIARATTAKAPAAGKW